MGLLKSTIADARTGKSGKTSAPEFATGTSVKTPSKTSPVHNQMHTGKTGPVPAKDISPAMHPVKPGHNDFQSKHYAPVDLSDKSELIKDKQNISFNKTVIDYQSKSKMSDHRSSPDTRHQSEHKTTLPAYETKVHKSDSLTVLPLTADNNTIFFEGSNKNTLGQGDFNDNEHLMNAEVEVIDKVTAKNIQHKESTPQDITTKQAVTQPDSIDKSLTPNSEIAAYKNTQQSVSAYPEVSTLQIKSHHTDQHPAVDEMHSSHIPPAHNQSKQPDLLDDNDGSRQSTKISKQQINPEQIDINRDDSYAHRSIISSRPDTETQENLHHQYSDASMLQAENTINEVNDKQSDVLMQMQRLKAEQAELHSELNAQPSAAAVQAQVIDNYSIANNPLRHIENNHVNSSEAPAKSAEVKIGQVDVFIEPPHRSDSRQTSVSRPSLSLASRHYLRRP